MRCTAATVARVASMILGLMLMSCTASMQARDVDVKKALLVDPTILKKGTGDQALYRYYNPNADLRKYSNVMIDPVIVDKSGKLDAKDLENYQKLANNAYVYLTDALKHDYRIVQKPEPGTMRIQMAIVEPDPSSPVRNVLSTVMPIGVGISLVKYAATGKQSGVGEITGEFKMTDAMTGELLGAAIDRRVGGKDVKGHFDTWHNADAALQYWAQRARYVLCTARGGADCKKP